MCFSWGGGDFFFSGRGSSCGKGEGWVDRGSVVGSEVRARKIYRGFMLVKEIMMNQV